MKVKGDGERKTFRVRIGGGIRTRGKRKNGLHGANPTSPPELSTLKSEGRIRRREMRR